MGKKCIVCDAPAVYGIKDTSDYYCEECAKENFADLALLIKVEEIARNLKQKLEEIQLDEEGQVIVDKPSCQLEHEGRPEAQPVSDDLDINESDDVTKTETSKKNKQSTILK